MPGDTRQASSYQRQRRRLRVLPTTAASRPHPSAPRRAARPPWRPLLAEIVVIGAHGGAGVSTLAALLGPAWDMGVVRGQRPGWSLRPGGRPVVLAARNTVAAAGQAVAATTAITRQGTQVAVLVVVSDGLPEPAEARYRFRVLEGRVGAVVRMPFIPALRGVGSPLQVDLPRRALRALAEIRMLAQEQAPRPVPGTRP
jgi:hypothetical protein